MATALRTRRPHWHRPEKGSGPAFVLSLLAHGLLFLSIAFVVQWKTEPTGPISAELWSGLPPPARPEEPVRVVPPPPVKVEQPPEPEPQKADIVLEQKKAEPPKKVEPPKKEEPPPKKIEPQKKSEPEKKIQTKADPKAEAKRQQEREAKAAADRHEQEMMRIAAAAGGPSAATGSSAAGGLTDSYRGQVVGCIRPHIVFNVPDGIAAGRYVAEYEVQLLPTGEQAGAPKLLKASGLAAYDQAVERAIRRCDPFPRPREGSMPRTLSLKFDPVDTR